MIYECYELPWEKIGRFTRNDNLICTSRMGLMNKSMETLNKLISFMVRQTHHERNQQVTVHPEPVEGFNQRIPRPLSFNDLLIRTQTCLST